MSLRIILATAVVGAVVGVLAQAGAAQVVPPFFGGGAVAVDPEVDVVPSGIVMAAQATVSHDLRYVTLTVGAQQTGLIELFEVRFPAGVAGGFVGGANLAAAGVAAPDPAAADPGPRGQPAGVLERQGMFFIRAQGEANPR